MNLHKEVETFCDAWGPRGVYYQAFVEHFRTLMNAYANEAIRSGALPDSVLHVCAPRQIPEYDWTEEATRGAVRCAYIQTLIEGRREWSMREICDVLDRWKVPLPETLKAEIGKAEAPV